jgi:DNA-binding NarL/FixJ family response regulator
MQPINVALVEDDPILRQALAQAVEHDATLRLTGQYADAETFLAALRTRTPDVVIMDLNLPGISGIACTEEARRIVPQLQILVCTVQDDDDSLFKALCAGATGYLLKDAPPERVAAAVKELHAGGSPMSGAIARRVITTFQKPKAKSKELDLLTERERQVLEQLAEGYRYKEIADRLFLSIDTVRTHVRNLYDKLHVSSRTDALNKLYPRS